MKTTPTKRRAWRAAPDPLNVTHAGFRTPHSTLRTCIVLCTLSVLCGLAVPVYADGIALIVGIDNYQSYGKLRTCRADALAMRKVLVRRCGFSERRVVLLVDDAPEPTNQPTYATLRGRIRQVTTLAGRDDELLIFFSGHGETFGNEGYLVPMNGSRDDTGTLLSLSWLNDQINESKARTRMLILDACHAGSASKGVGGVAPSAVKPVQTLMLLSCSAREQSYPDKAGGVSVFTRFLVEGLSGKADRNKDKRVTHEELFSHLQKAMADWCLASGKTQTPVLVGDVREAMTLARVSGFVPAEPHVSSREDLGLPKGWRTRRMRLKVATPNGNRSQYITYFGNTIGMAFVKITPGEFVMGTDRGGKEASPAHRVRISESFYMGAHEVTNRQFRLFRSHHDSRDFGGRSLNDDRFPAVHVSWEDAKRFCEWLWAKEGVFYRLPTEAEWEYACRAGCEDLYWWGNSEKRAGDCANVADRAARRHDPSWTVFDTDDGHVLAAPVGSFLPNRIGLYDMIGNVWEWCEDWFDPDYYARSPSVDPKGPPSGSLRVRRCSSWINEPKHSLSANRYGSRPDERIYDVGFRVVCSPRR